MVAEGIRQLQLPVAAHLKDLTDTYSPAAPDDPDGFVWDDAPFVEVLKPDGN